MGAMQPGDKLTAANLNAAYICKSEDDSSTGRLKTDRYFVEGKRDEVASVGQTLIADVGVLLLTAPGTLIGTEGASAITPDPTQGAENGQKLTIINCSGGEYLLSFLSVPLELPDGAGITLYYCSTKANWLPVGGTGSGGGAAIVEVSGPAPGVVGNLVYNNAGTWTLSDGSDLTGVASATHMIVEVGATDYSIQQSGPVEIPGHGYVVGDQYFQSTTVTGDSQQATPAFGEVTQTAFDVIDGDWIELNLQNEATIQTDLDPDVDYNIRTLPADISSNGVIVPLSPSGLTVGKTYRLFVNAFFRITTIDGAAGILMEHAGNTIGRGIFTVDPVGTSPQLTAAGGIYTSVSVPFVATTTTAEISATNMSTGDSIDGDDSLNETFSWVEELPNHNLNTGL